ncbi:bi-domain-containing oxidoreductase [Sphingomonas sp. PB2P19]|uniref:bi-domain-containing oxidoreductase n=1 Tax=Sphingomonas rhamnosi TaxID=3096156 RepID=UPI002FC61043
MRQLIQHLDSGTTELIEVPYPADRAHHLVIESRATLISAGTERMLVDFAKASLLSKARQQPERVKEVLDKAMTNGLLTTIDAVRSKLGQPIALGYCNVGVVRSVGSNVSGFAVGDRVASNGAHSEVVRVPANLCAKVPDGVDDESAAFTVLASIGLQGIRLAQPTLGERFMVIGAGLIGLVTIQMLVSNGVRVLAVDVDDSRLELARRFGAETCNPAEQDPVVAAQMFSNGIGVDAVLITASTTANTLVNQAADSCRQRGRIILIGVTGLELDRAKFYNKEISFQVSCSYGPGRYDPSYEEGGNDYPIGFVRWTEQRNFATILDLMAAGRIDTQSLVTHRFAFSDATQAYAALTESKSTLGVVMRYAAQETAPSRTVTLATPDFRTDKPVLTLIGAGNYASRVLIPALRANNAQLDTIVTSGGFAGVVNARRAEFARSSTDASAAIADPRSNTIIVVTRHDSHAAFVLQAVNLEKHVFVEKPLALKLEEVDAIEASYRRQDNPRQIMVGFNRRFAPTVRALKKALDTITEPKALVLTMNAGALPRSHWAQDSAIGGGRIIGEACHFIDLARFLIGAPIQEVISRAMTVPDSSGTADDKASIILTFADGSIATIHYLANGGSAFPKERIEAFAGGRTAQIDNFRALRTFNWPGLANSRSMRQDKGQEACIGAFLQAIETGTPAIDPTEIFEVARITIEAARQIAGS